MSKGPSPRDAETVYELYRRGIELLEDGDAAEAVAALSEAARHEPDKSSIREALGRAYYRTRSYELAAAEFAEVVERYPVNDYAHHCLGRALRMTGNDAGARRHLAIAANLRPDRRDYRVHRERARR